MSMGLLYITTLLACISFVANDQTSVIDTTQDKGIIIEEKRYATDTLSLFSRQIEIHIPISRLSYSDGTDYYVKNFSSYLHKEDEDYAWIRFESYFSGDTYYLELRTEKSGLVITNVYMNWMNSTYNINAGSEEEPDMIPLTASCIVYKEVHTPVNGAIVLDDCFEYSDDFQSCYYPRRYSFDEVLTRLKNNRQFWISDFENGEEE